MVSRTATPSVNVTPSMTCGNWLAPFRRRHVFAALSSFNGADSAWTRGNGGTNAAFDVSGGEDAIADPETNHIAESVDFLAFNDAGTISAAPMQNIAETGTLSLNHTTTTMTLQRSYENSAMIAHLATENGAQPLNVRVSGVNGNDLTPQMLEPNYLEGAHKSETVNYMVVEAGTWVLPDGTLLEVGTLNSNQLSSHGFESVAFDAAFDAAPTVLRQVQTRNGHDFVTTCQRDADADSFRLTMQVQEEALNDGGHTTETLGWVAIEAGSSTAGNVTWRAGSTSGVTDATATVDSWRLCRAARLRSRHCRASTVLSRPGRAATAAPTRRSTSRLWKTRASTPRPSTSPRALTTSRSTTR